MLKVEFASLQVDIMANAALVDWLVHFKARGRQKPRPDLDSENQLSSGKEVFHLEC